MGKIFEHDELLVPRPISAQPIITLYVLLRLSIFLVGTALIRKNLEQTQIWSIPNLTSGRSVHILDFSAWL